MAATLALCFCLCACLPPELEFASTGDADLAAEAGADIEDRAGDSASRTMDAVIATADASNPGADDASIPGDTSTQGDANGREAGPLSEGGIAKETGSATDVGVVETGRPGEHDAHAESEAQIGSDSATLEDVGTQKGGPDASGADSPSDTSAGSTDAQAPDVAAPDAACSRDCTGKACGAPDGCGGHCSQGACTPPDTCGGGGTPNVCGCTPDCSGGRCDVDDGCGHTCGCGLGLLCLMHQCVIQVTP